MNDTNNYNIQLYKGLNNYGNSCYFNSSIQFLKPIFDIISSSYELTDDIIKVLLEYYDYYSNSDSLKKKYKYICKKLQSNFGQQDTDEAILTILDDIMLSLNNASKKILDVGIKYQHLILCSECSKYKVCNDGNIQVENVIISKYLTTNPILPNIVPFKKILGSILNVEDAGEAIIDTFKKEKSCNCSGKKITIQTVLTDMPNFLIVYINRCAYGSPYKVNNKIEIANHFEITTPISPENRYNKTNYEDMSHQYELYGIIVHSGITQNSGHYYTYSKNNYNNTWYKCNDTNIYKIDNFDQNNPDIQSNCSALLYIKKNKLTKILYM